MESHYIYTFFLYFLFLFVIFNIFANLNDHKYFNTVQSGYLNFLTLVFCLTIVGLIAYISVKRFQINQKVITVCVALFIFFISFAVVIIKYSNISSALVLYIQYLSSFIVILMFLVLLTIVANYWYQHFMKIYRGTKIEFVLRFIFFLPCLLINLLKYLLKDFKSTPYITPILVIIEVILILLYVYIPVFLSKLSLKNYTLIRDVPFFLRNELYYNTDVTTVPNPDIAKIDNSGQKKQTNIISLNEVDHSRIYSISMWLLIKQTNTSMKDAIANDYPIFTYGDNTTFRPQITYHAHNNGELADKNDPMTDKIRINLSSYTHYDLFLSKQKWHNLIITYYDDRVEIYVNGAIITVMKMSDIEIIKDTLSVNYKFFLGSADYTFGNMVPDIILCNVHLYETPLNYADAANVYNVGKNTFPYPGSYT